LFTRLDDHRGRARALGNLGAVALRRSDFAVAIDLSRQALELFIAVGDEFEQGGAHLDLATALAGRKEAGSAAKHAQQAEAIFERLGDSTLAGHAHTLLAALGDRAQAHANSRRVR
jgi:tetratricopeptide (TPR) repeat protein